MFIQMIYKILYYDRIDVSEGIDLNKSSATKEFIICYYLYLLNKGLGFNQLFVMGVKMFQ